MKLELTEADYRVIFEQAHREWMEDSGHSRYKKQPDQYLLARSYFQAVLAFLASRGYKVEMNDDKDQNKG